MVNGGFANKRRSRGPAALRVLADHLHRDGLHLRVLPQAAIPPGKTDDRKCNPGRSRWITITVWCLHCRRPNPRPPHPPHPSSLVQKYCIVPADKDTSEGWATLESKFSKHKVITSNIGRAGGQVILTIHGRCQTFYILQMDTVCSERWSSLSWEIHKTSITLVRLTHVVCYGETAHHWFQSSSVTAALCTTCAKKKLTLSLLLLKRSFKNPCVIREPRDLTT